jgi:hypothetical protein
MTATRLLAGLAIIAALFYAAVPEKKARLFHQSGLRSYDLEYEQKIFNFLLSSAPAPAFVQMRAKLYFRVLEVGDEKVDVVLQLDQIDLRMEPENAPLTRALREYYGHAVSACFRPDGTLLSMGFPGLEENYAGYRQMFMQMEMLLQERAVYTSLQKDELGSFRADYTRASDRVVRTKKRYDDTDERSILVYQSKAEALLPSQKNWFESFSLVEKIRIKKEGKKVLQMLTKIRVNASDEVTTEDKKGVAMYDEEDSLEAVRNDTNLFEKIERDQQRDYFTERGYDFAKLLQEIREGSDAPEGYAKLESYLKLHPDEIVELHAVINASQNDVARGLIALLESLQLPQSQALLSEMATDPGTVEMNRIRSVIALSGQESPTQNVLSSLEMLAGERGPTGTESLANTALLALGSLGSKSDEAMQASLPTLQKALENASDYNDAKAALLAAKNAGVAPLVNEIIPYLSSENVKLRKLSVSLLSGYTDNAAVQADIRQQRLAEQDADVKKALSALLDAGH